MSKISRYFSTRRALYRVPLQISAAYDRRAMTQQQAMMLMAAKARDPQMAEKLLAELQQQHGLTFWQQVKFHLLRLVDHKTFTERVLILFRRAFGESDSPIPRQRRRKREQPIIQYRFRDYE